MSNKLERIIELREKLNYSQRKFALSIGKTGSYLSQIELGNNPITPQLIDAIVANLNVNRTWLETGQGEMFGDKFQTNNVPEWAEELMRKIDKLMEIQTAQTGEMIKMLGKPSGSYVSGMRLSYKAIA